MSWDQGLLVSAFRRVEARLDEVLPPSDAFLVESLTPSRTLFVAVDADGSWSLVVRARKSLRPVPALRLSLLSADYGATYELREGDDVGSLRVCVVRCIASDPEIRNLFATVCAALLKDLPASPSDADVDTEVGKWVSLFWRLQMPARTTVIGLIGELTLLDSVEHLADWIRAWHSDPDANLDFAFATPPLSVEVKATSSQQRVHELSIHQALPMVRDNHFFASVIIELRDSGVRLGDVVAELGERLAGRSEAILLWRSLVAVCGASLGEFLDARYMREVARRSLRFYVSESVPQPSVEFPLPAGVSGLRFRSDFSSATPVDGRTILDVEAV
ncbi:PD-(D/E)XK motif protein [Microbacterium sp. NPDC089189]|uniref:PD-(D/E)XK motif protein n=1 Tax=Microbacterium sp. NPDC089189 TaxID=3154972 RepID=UPI003448E6E3